MPQYEDDLGLAAGIYEYISFIAAPVTDVRAPHVIIFLLLPSSIA